MASIILNESTYNYFKEVAKSEELLSKQCDTNSKLLAASAAISVLAYAILCFVFPLALSSLAACSFVGIVGCLVVGLGREGCVCLHVGMLVMFVCLSVWIRLGGVGFFV